MADPLADETARVHTATGFKRLNPVWAKVEILLGLTAVGIGAVLALRLSRLSEADVPWWAWIGPVALFVLGGYLALAGHRSHLYQSNTRLAAYLAGQTRISPPTSRP